MVALPAATWRAPATSELAAHQRFVLEPGGDWLATAALLLLVAGCFLVGMPALRHAIPARGRARTVALTALSVFSIATAVHGARLIDLQERHAQVNHLNPWWGDDRVLAAGGVGGYYLGLTLLGWLCLTRHQTSPQSPPRTAYRVAGTLLLVCAAAGGAAGVLGLVAPEAAQVLGKTGMWLGTPGLAILAIGAAPSQ